MSREKINKRVLLGFGDIAQRLARISLIEGHAVTGVRRSALAIHGVRTISGDVRSSETLKRALDGESSDIVVTLTPDNYSEQGYRDAYLACTRSLAETVVKESPDSRIIFVSSTSVYGQDSGELVDEQSECSPTSLTAKVLLEAEKVITDIGLEHCNLRFSGIYGPGRTRLIESVKSGRIGPPLPTHWTNRIHADDCAGAIDHLLRLPTGCLPECVLGTDSLPAPRFDVQHFIARKLGLSMVKEEELVKSTSTAATGKRCSNQLLLDLDYEFLYPDYRAGFSALLDSR